MHSTLKPKQADDPHDVLVVAPDVARVVPGDEELSNLLRAAVRLQTDLQTHTPPGPAAAPPVRPVDTTFRPAAVNDVRNNVHVAGSRRSIGRRMLRGFAAVLAAVCIGVAGIASQVYGDAAIQMITKTAPQLLTSLISLLPREKPGLSAQPAPPVVQADAANALPPQPAAPAQAAAESVAPAAPEAVAPTAAAQSPDQGQLLQSMAHDLAGLGQQVEQLKASIEELKAGQQQMSREIAKASEQNLRPKISALPPRPPAARPRKPMPPLPPPQATAARPLPQAAAPYVPQAAAPYVPRQVEPPLQATAQPRDEELSSVPRPPMPVR
jgi:hypothetical protein